MHTERTRIEKSLFLEEMLGEMLLKSNTEMICHNCLSTMPFTFVYRTADIYLCASERRDIDCSEHTIEYHSIRRNRF